MALELYQEIIPFTNEKMPRPVSLNNSYSNPVVMPLSFDVTSVYNTVESVIYIRNDDKDKYYKNVSITLMAPKGEFLDTGVATSTYTIESVACSAANTLMLKQTGGSVRHLVDVEWSSEMTPTLPIQMNQSTWFDGSSNSMLPVSGVEGYKLSQLNSSLNDIKFSYGYDEVSETAWTYKKHGIIIPQIGTSTMPDNSFIPIRVRIYMNDVALLTLKKYAFNVSYSEEIGIV